MLHRKILFAGIIIIIIISLQIFTCIKAFNFDTNYSIIIENRADGNKSLFGTTVLLTKEGGPSVIVGSPRSNSTHQNHKGIVEPGVVWQCSIAQNRNCKVLVMDPTGNDVDQLLENVVDRKDYGWLGGALVENEDSFVACGSRWSNKFYENSTKGEFHMNGICHWQPKNKNEKNVRLIPLALNPEKQVQVVWERGQAGFSIYSSEKTKEIILGAPGVRNWKGSVIKMSSQDKFQNVYVLDSGQSSLNFQTNSYFGFAIDSGRFLGPNKEVQYASSAPRDKDLKGRVVVFKFPTGSSNDIDKLDEVEGPQIGAYFGFSICVADVNGDGWDDLLVGAPMYSAIHGSIFEMGKMSNIKGKSLTKGNGDEGAVFIYHGSEKNRLQKQMLPLSGNKAWSHFGTSIANLGDMNNDGIADIAVGAPYANEGTGQVYIFYGSKNGLSKTAVQVILGSELYYSIKGFGYSLASGKDIDSNGYNELAIGAFDSSHVVVLRSRPLVNVTGIVRSTITQLPFDTNSFEVQSCIVFTGKGVPYKQVFTVRIMADVQSKPRPQRVNLIPIVGNGPNATEHVYKVEVSNGIESCTSFTALIIRPLETSANPVEIVQEISLNEQKVSKNAPTLFNISSFGGQPRTTVAGADYEEFCQNCPLMSPKNTNLTSLKLPIAVPCGDDNKCTSDLYIEVNFEEIKMGESFTIGLEPSLTMNVSLRNELETAIAPTIIISWKSRTLRKNPSECNFPSQNDTDMSTQIKCSLGRVLETKKSKSIIFEFDMSDLVAGQMDEFSLQIEAQTVSDVKDSSQLLKMINIHLRSVADIFMEGSNSRDNFNLETLNPASIVSHNYEIELDGPSPIAGAILEFQLPVRMELTSKPKMVMEFDLSEPRILTNPTNLHVKCNAVDGKFKAFRTLQVSRNIGEIEDTEDKELVTTEGFEDDEYDLDEEEINVGGIWTKSGEELPIDCSSSKIIVKCITVKCEVMDKINPDQKITVSFSSLVDSNSLKTFFKKSKFSSMKISSTGTSKILGVKENIQPDSHKPDDAIAIFVIKEELAKKVPISIYLLGILLGLIILAVIVYCLYRLGLFVRKGPKNEADKAESVPLEKKPETKKDGESVTKECQEEEEV